MDLRRLSEIRLFMLLIISSSNALLVTVIGWCIVAITTYAFFRSELPFGIDASKLAVCDLTRLTEHAKGGISTERGGLLRLYGS